MDNIGALELGDCLASFDDGALEASSMHPAPTMPPGTCQVGPPTLRGLTCVSDGALESAADKALLGVTQNFCYPTKLGCKTFP